MKELSHPAPSPHWQALFDAVNQYLDNPYEPDTQEEHAEEAKAHFLMMFARDALSKDGIVASGRSYQLIPKEPGK